MSLDREEFLAGFSAEADEHLRAATQNLLALETAAREGKPQARLVRELFRSLHTLKGLAAMVEVEPIVELAHEMEAALRIVDRTGQRLELATIERLILGVRAIVPRVAAVAAGHPVAPAPPELVAQLAGLRGGGAAAAPDTPRLELPEELAGKLGPGDLELLVAAAREGAARSGSSSCPRARSPPAA